MGVPGIRPCGLRTGALLAGTLTEGTTEAAFHPELLARGSDITLTKTRSSCFVRSDLDERLRHLGIDTLVIAGYSINRCVGLTAIDAWELDYGVVLAGEAVLGTTESEAERMLGYLATSFGIEPSSNEEIRATLLHNDPKNQQQ